MEDTKGRELQEIGRGAAESIEEMVAALGVDYERLEELKDRECRTCLKGEPCCHSDALDEDEQEELKELLALAGECESEEQARERIQEDPLSLEVRSGWYAPGGEAGAPEEFCLLLGTGGPAVRIMGELDEHGQPTRAYLQVQDWFTPWMDYIPTTGEGWGKTLMTYCEVFYFGEGA